MVNKDEYKISRLKEFADGSVIISVVNHCDSSYILYFKVLNESGKLC